MRKIPGLPLLLLALFAVAPLPPSAAEEAPYYTEEQTYTSRPRVGHGETFGHIGPTGIVGYLKDGTTLRVESVQAGSPADGRFAVGDVITGVDGETLKGRNPFVVLGQAITRAEAGSGELVFGVLSGDTKKSVSVRIPVLGAYSPTWPLDCAKSAQIVDEAAAYYAEELPKTKGQGIPGALMSLFLLSTGDDQYLPVVRGYFKPLVANPGGIGEHTWNNGYNGVACAEYYLRTGDRSVLPVLQAYCDDARDRQNFDSGWKHWGADINPRYVGGGLMNPAGAQVLTTLLLAKECGVDVDEPTLMGALKFFYRFAGHGTVPYGDHRGEGGLASNGKDSMIAVAMEVAAGTQGDASPYREARDYLSMSTLHSYPGLVTGHADEGRGDGIWRGVSASLILDRDPGAYRAMMDRIAWWLDLSRFHDGGMGMAINPRFNEAGSGAGVVLAYTAPRRTLRITGAPPSAHAKEFTLPSTLWGRPADRAFLRITHASEYLAQGPAEPTHVPFYQLGSAYRKSTTGEHPMTKAQVRRNVFHHRYMIRSQAAKELRRMGALDDLEALLTHEDPRVRRAALDGIIDYRYWFAMGKEPLAPEAFTPGMIKAITGMLHDPNEAWYVIDGALFAMNRMPAAVIAEHVDVIAPWTKHEEWWLRESSFMALQGMEKDPALYQKILPHLVDISIAETHTMPRQRMGNTLQKALKKHGVESPMGRLIATGFERGVRETPVLEGRRSMEGLYNVLNDIKLGASAAPQTAAALADDLPRWFGELRTGDLVGLLKGDGPLRGGLLGLCTQKDNKAAKALQDVLYEKYLPELQKRMRAGERGNLALVDVALAVKDLRDDATGWHILGQPVPGERTWDFISFDPTVAEEQLPKRNGKRFREITLPEEWTNWHQPDFAAKGWNQGPAPIGIGTFRGRKNPFPLQSEWGDGEFLLARTTFEVERKDYDLYRLRILAIQGYQVYLNGKRIERYGWWRRPPQYASAALDKKHMEKLLQIGTNTLSVIAVVEYPSAIKPHWTGEVFGQMDAYLEGLYLDEVLGE